MTGFRQRAAPRCSSEAREMFGEASRNPRPRRRLEKMLADRAQHDDPHAMIRIGRFEGDAHCSR